ncbi:fasciclin domain-containing protein [Nocardioides pakistanensis]
MHLRRLSSTITALVLGAGLAAVPASAQGAERPAPGNRSAAAVLAADSGFDRTARDFDILESAVEAVLEAKPDSPVAVLAQGRTRLTVFAPTDGAFRRLVEDLTGTRYAMERRVFNTLAAAAGIDTIESVLLYHVVPGATIGYRQAKAANGAELATALDGAELTVRVRHGHVFLVDTDRNDPNARVQPWLRNINQGNRQIIHGVSQVLRPIDL